MRPLRSEAVEAKVLLLGIRMQFGERTKRWVNAKFRDHATGTRADLISDSTEANRRYPSTV